MTFEKRSYRSEMQSERFHSFSVKYLETDLWIGIEPKSYNDKIPLHCKKYIKELHTQLSHYIENHPQFRLSLAPLPFDQAAPIIAQEMLIQSQNSGVGPMACVAGAFSHFVGNEIISKYNVDEIIIENGGDIFLKVKEPINIAVFAGDSPLSGKIGIEILPEMTPVGICTSSASVGPSLSLGKTDATMIVCNNTALADGFASHFGNMVLKQSDIELTIEKIKKYPEIISAIIVCGDRFGIGGKLKLKLF
jgi:uncharacterized protein